MKRTAGRGYQLTGREAMPSPGAPSLRNEIERRFWELRFPRFFAFQRSRVMQPHPWSAEL
ncbi:hypothetical protein A8E25_35940 [Burkholderia cenocepacia]|nr:hypothetical protein [Pseudomonas aeruginosa]ONR59336.1 hypothetical protein A8E23_34845 [Burkholderia cenocepacia]ONR64172.1 hypothetical protein A8E17_07645 [Burkholderia cenocepacia]ONR71524.1 hypothetical protein A8E18_16600 [Burkholderia cenocepacia]ONR77014.1 hypothetical protein A8E22_22735 [Burkholderia cenocepacia]